MEIKDLNFLRLLRTVCLFAAIFISEGCASANSHHAGTSQREVEIRELLHDNLSWAFGTHSLTKPYKWPDEEDVIEVFKQLTDDDIPVLINIIRADVAQGKGLLNAETNSAIWVLSFFKDKAKAPVLRLYHDPSISQAERAIWKDELDAIKARSTTNWR
jgi:hypothetical protein